MQNLSSSCYYFYVNININLPRFLCFSAIYFFTVRRPCSLGLCLNGGTCVDGSYTNSKYGFACVCLRGFDGIMCEKRLPDDLGETLRIA